MDPLHAGLVGLLPRYNVSATDPTTLSGVAAVWVLVAPIARAMRVDPAVALRQE